MPNGWQVTGQRGTSDLINGRLTPCMQVDVRTDDGTEKSFLIPDAQYTADKVEAIVGDWYERHQAIAGL